MRNQLENRTLATYENLYNYRYDPKFRAVNVNAPYQPNIPTIYGGTVQKVPVLDEKGNILYYEQKVIDPGTQKVMDVPTQGFKFPFSKKQKIAMGLPANAIAPAQQSQLGQPNPYVTDNQSTDDMEYDQFETPDQIKEKFLNPFGKNGKKISKKKNLNSSIVRAMKNL